MSARKAKTRVDIDDLSESEETSEVETKKRRKLSDRELEEYYDETSARILQERSDFLLPQVVGLVETKRWANLRPEYQRRLRWDAKKKSLLIESLLMNIPIPPVFLYERELNRYEVMDGQQRLVSILDFYQNRLTLKGLEFWPDLNGRTYKTCPPRIRRGLDRRRISAVVLLAESKNPSDDRTQDIRLQVFERLNTGGTPLNAQELRNCAFTGPFNDLIVKLARLRLFNEMWDMPPYEDNVDAHGNVSPELASDRLFKTMTDCHIVLRFFAFREDAEIRGSVRSMLDRCMERGSALRGQEIKTLESEFESRLRLVRQIFGREAFKLPVGEQNLSRPLFDALMIALDSLWDRRSELLKKKAAINKRFPALFESARAYGLIVGKPNTARAVKARIKLVRSFLASAL